MRNRYIRQIREYMGGGKREEQKWVPKMQSKAHCGSQGKNRVAACTLCIPEYSYLNDQYIQQLNPATRAEMRTQWPVAAVV